MLDNKEKLEEFSEAISDFITGYTGSIKTFDHLPSDVEFLRDVCLHNVPCVINGMMNNWPAYSKWDLDYFKNNFGEKLVSINYTPDGLGDAVKYDKCITSDNDTGYIFTYPYENQVKLEDFIDCISNPNIAEDAVPYLSQQDDNIRKNFPELMVDIPSSISLGDVAFASADANCDSSIAAINLWIGDARSVSSMHKDHYHNFYFVVEGTKTFTLFPPCDAAFICEGEYRVGAYQLKQDARHNSCRLQKNDIQLARDEDDSKRIRWIKDDPDDSRYAKSFEHTHLVHVSLSKGQCLFIPSMWYHRVSQTEPTIAVNYWYEMSYNHSYVFYNLVKTAFNQ